MSVIAKMYVAAIRDFGDGRLVDLSCVAENDMMAAYAGSEEDRLFTKYSPWGEARMTVPLGMLANVVENDKFFVIASRDAEKTSFDGAVVLVEARCSSLTDNGTESKRVEFMNRYRSNSEPLLEGVAKAFNWRMSVDNPGASNQFVPGTEDWTIGLYPAAAFNRDEAIAAAHS